MKSLHNSCIKLRHWPHDLISLEYLKQESARIFLSGMSKQKWTLSSLNLVGISGSGQNMIKKMRFSWRSGRGLVIWLTFECRRSNGTVERIGVIQIGLKESQVLLLHKNPSELKILTWFSRSESPWRRWRQWLLCLHASTWRCKFWFEMLS